MCQRTRGFRERQASARRSLLSYNCGGMKSALFVHLRIYEVTECGQCCRSGYTAPCHQKYNNPRNLSPVSWIIDSKRFRTRLLGRKIQNEAFCKHRARPAAHCGACRACVARLVPLPARSLSDRLYPKATVNRGHPPARTASFYNPLLRPSTRRMRLRERRQAW